MAVRTSDSRPLGSTENNWCKALECGTGVTIIGVLFDTLDPFSIPALQAALVDVLLSQPLLRSHIVTKEGGQRWFNIADKLSLEEIEIDVSTCSDPSDSPPDENVWIRFVEAEMNTPYPPPQTPHPGLLARFHRLPNSNNSSLLLLRFHPAASDLGSGVLLALEILAHLARYVNMEKDGNGDNIRELLQSKREMLHLADQKDVARIELPSLEDAIPPGLADKPFWARGANVIGYGLVSRRHAYLPFDNPGKPTASRIVRFTLPQAVTEKLLTACKGRNVDLYGVISAATIKSVASFKKVGSRGEHYGVICLLNCRKLLQPPIPDSTAGFYHSAVMRTIHATEDVEMWELAAKCTRDFEEAISSRKHFTDMGDLNLLMMQAMLHPNLTPHGSMRTGLLSAYHDPIEESFGESPETSVLGIKDWVSCSSSHGVGPCLAIFPSLRNGSLKITLVYCTPLFEPTTVEKVVDSITANISSLI